MDIPTTESQGHANGSCDRCRLRKLRCDRNIGGCSSCKVSETVCCYPSFHESSRKKRGPYRKGKTKNELELERTVKILEAKNESLLELLSRMNANRQGEVNLNPSSDCTTPVLRGSTSTTCLLDISQQCHQASLESLIEHDSCVESLLAREATKPAPSNNGCLPERTNDNRLVFPAMNTHTSNLRLANELLHVLSSPGLGFNITRQFPPNRSWQGPSTRVPSGLHPTQGSRAEYWSIFIRKIEPVVAIVRAADIFEFFFHPNHQTFGDGFEALMFSVYYSVVATCTETETELRLSECKAPLSLRYRTAFGTALLQTLFDGPLSLPVLQALVLYLVVEARANPSNDIWALLRLTWRIAETFNLEHEESSQVQSGSISELQTSLWSSLYVLESLRCEIYGLSPYNQVTLPDEQYAHLVGDIERSLSHLVTSLQVSSGCRAFLKINYDFARIRTEILKKSSEPNGGSPSPQDRMDYLFKLVIQKEASLQEGHLNNLNPDQPFDWLLISYTRLMAAKSRLLIYYSCDISPKRRVSWSVKDDAFALALEILEAAQTLKTDQRIASWSWLFRPQIEWQALLYTIKVIRHCVNPVQAKRAWSLLDQSSKGEALCSAFWQPLHDLVLKVLQNRPVELSHYPKSAAELYSDTSILPTRVIEAIDDTLWTDNTVEWITSIDSPTFAFSPADSGPISSRMSPVIQTPSVERTYSAAANKFDVKVHQDSSAWRDIDTELNPEVFTLDPAFHAILGSDNIVDMC